MTEDELRERIRSLAPNAPHEAIEESVQKVVRLARHGDLAKIFDGMALVWEHFDELGMDGPARERWCEELLDELERNRGYNDALARQRMLSILKVIPGGKG